MGWWRLEKNGHTLDIGDQPLDILGVALRKIANTYRRDLKRKPTSEELSELLQSSIRIIEEDLFDNMEERELETVSVSLRSRTRRPRPKPGDYFAIPLPSGGYAYGRIMNISLRVIMWMKLLSKRSDSILPVDDITNACAILDIKTGTDKINSMDWPIIGYDPLSPEDVAGMSNEPEWITGFTGRDVQSISEWKLAGKPGLPPEMGKPYVGYRD